MNARAVIEAESPKKALRVAPKLPHWDMVERKEGKWLFARPVRRPVARPMGALHARKPQTVMFKLIKSPITPGFYDLYFYHSIHGIVGGGSTDEEISAETDELALEQAKAQANKFFASEGYL